jgi:sulfur-oxidizing protein SoxZ
MATKPRIKLPESANTGEVIEVKALVSHVMETGNRKTPEGQAIPRSILHTFKVTFDGAPVFSADWGSGIAANPFIGFFFKVPGPGTFEFTWIGDTGETIVEQTPLIVS